MAEQTPTVEQVRRCDGPKIRRLRQRADLSVDEMVERLKAEGVDRHPDSIRKGETGKAGLGFKVVNAIARVLGVDSDELWLDETATIKEWEPGLSGRTLSIELGMAVLRMDGHILERLDLPDGFYPDTDARQLARALGAKYVDAAKL
jgi:transcriptional regulator with XRE-family HTH domain